MDEDPAEVVRVLLRRYPFLGLEQDMNGTGEWTVELLDCRCDSGAGSSTPIVTGRMCSVMRYIYSVGPPPRFAKTMASEERSTKSVGRSVLTTCRGCRADESACFLPP